MSFPFFKDSILIVCHLSKDGFLIKIKVRDRIGYMKKSMSSIPTCNKTEPSGGDMLVLG